ncbi:hypothetical protein L1887_18088 [Cichorium endivia]|nr:hypothetical protein L1887_18088 [Cichorium endivia]
MEENYKGGLEKNKTVQSTLQGLAEEDKSKVNVKTKSDNPEGSKKGNEKLAEDDVVLETETEDILKVAKTSMKQLKATAEALEGHEKYLEEKLSKNLKNFHAYLTEVTTENISLRNINRVMLCVISTVLSNVTKSIHSPILRLRLVSVNYRRGLQEKSFQKPVYYAHPIEKEGHCFEVIMTDFKSMNPKDIFIIAIKLASRAGNCRVQASVSSFQNILRATGH